MSEKGLEEQDLSELGVLERQDLQEWTIEQPRILGEDLQIITSEYANFQDTRDRLDLLALDPTGKLVVIELKRDQADRTTDLQAIKYASYCATLTAEDIQRDYREFWNERDDTELTPEDVGQTFADFLEGIEEEIPLTGDGWAEFELDQKPRILLAAGSFGTEITAPVMWLIEEYGMDITCTKVEAYEHQGRVLLNSQQVIPVAEAEEYMTKRREKQETPPNNPKYREDSSNPTENTQSTYDETENADDAPDHFLHPTLRLTFFCPVGFPQLSLANNRVYDFARPILERREIVHFAVGGD
jgi:hypothetical protein